MDYSEEQLGLILQAVRFSAHKHRDQRRKGRDASPYINHPIEVAERLWSLGEVRDPDIIIAAILHDTIEDTDTTPAEIEDLFGPAVLTLVREVSDDKNLPKEVRKQLQIQHARHSSTGAKQIKLSDKISNVEDIATSPPDWPMQRRIDYLNWAEQVVAGLRGANPKLESRFDEALGRARARLQEEMTHN